MANFTYDVITLIELVESKPCLWDKTHDDNKNKGLRNRCWREIFLVLERGFEELCWEEQKKIGDAIMQKWRNIRDAFTKSMRIKSGDGAKRNYLYAENLKFLLKLAEKDDTEINCSYKIEFVDTSRSLYPIPSSPTSSQPACEPPPPAPRRERLFKNTHKKKRGLGKIEKEILEHIKRPAPRAEPRDDKEILMLSVLPYIRDMNENEMMELQMEILSSIHKIKQKRYDPSSNNLDVTPHKSLVPTPNERGSNIEIKEIVIIQPATSNPDTNRQTSLPDVNVL